MSRSAWRLAFGLLIVALVLAACGATPEEAPAAAPPEAGEPAPETTSEVEVEAVETAVAPTPQPAVPEPRLLVLEWPRAVRAGDGAVVRLSLEVDEAGRITPTAQVAGNQIRGEPVSVPDLYDTHNVVALARLDLAGVDVAPLGEVAEPMQRGQTVFFFWSLRPVEVGHYVGTIWVHLEFVPRDPASGLAVEQITLSAQQFDFAATNFMGLGGTAARIMGGAGVVLGAMLGLDKLLAWVWSLVRALFARREKA